MHAGIEKYPAGYILGKSQKNNIVPFGKKVRR